MMRICFVSNYINHHQIPFCNAMYQETKGEFVFIQTEPMEEERVQMGWQEKERPDYVHCYYEEPEWCRQQMLDCDVMLFGGCDDESYVQERLSSGKMLIRYSERLYKTGQWKAISPRGLLKKYKDHTRYKKAPVYLLCAGGYVASDFHIIRAYKGKMFCWGYFPETRHYDWQELLEAKGYEQDGRKVAYLLWAARFIDWKHPERALEMARTLKGRGIPFHLDMIGGGSLEPVIEDMIRSYELEDQVSLLGYKTPTEVRAFMEKADIFLMTSDRREGWGAVANEAMNSGCVVVADHMPGAVPFLIRSGVNGCVYPTREPKKLGMMVEQLIIDEERRRELAQNAYETIVTHWNAENAATKLMELIKELMAGKGTYKGYLTKEVGNGGFYPCAPAPVICERYRI
ncbi:MAG: glycosyltransferase [Lachnospiraceae bacterium]|nr:glycosyltransferase [Lachnospiraceae bacterium]